MPVNPVRHNPAALALVQDVLAEQASLAFGDIDRFADGRGRLGMIPIYSMPARQLAARRWNKGWRSGWRYYWVHPDLDDGITVEILRIGDKKSRLGAVSFGQEALSLRAALEEMTQRFASDHRRYRPRILRLPWIGMEAIWLNTDSLRSPDRFYSRTDELQNAAFIEETARRARAFLAR